MKTKTVYSFGPDRIYAGPVELDESDLSPADEGDVWLIPGNCMATAPPPAVEGKRHFAAANGRWVEEDIPVPELPPEPSLPEVPVEEPAPPAPEPREPTREERAAALRSEVQKHLDLTAAAHGYDDIRTAVTYADEPAVPRFQAQGRAFRAWRSLVWDFCYALQDKVTAGLAEEPTVEQLLPMLPVCDFLAFQPAPEPELEPGSEPPPVPAAPTE
ncbi:hypothetical protein [Variovorax sp. GB1P17]|uniref:hypothetical protein n=1 Tax=Variovorax sp. GB1P17 TaxID=3443740 RepID=UPI003F481151